MAELQPDWINTARTKAPKSGNKEGAAVLRGGLVTVDSKDVPKEASAISF